MRKNFFKTGTLCCMLTAAFLAGCGNNSLENSDSTLADTSEATLAFTEADNKGDNTVTDESQTDNNTAEAEISDTDIEETEETPDIPEWKIDFNDEDYRVFDCSLDDIINMQENEFDAIIADIGITSMEDATGGAAPHKYGSFKIDNNTFFAAYKYDNGMNKIDANSYIENHKSGILTNGYWEDENIYYANIYTSYNDDLISYSANHIPEHTTYDEILDLLHYDEFKKNIAQVIDGSNDYGQIEYLQFAYDIGDQSVTIYSLHIYTIGDETYIEAQLRDAAGNPERKYIFATDNETKEITYMLVEKYYNKSEPQ